MLLPVLDLTEGKLHMEEAAGNVEITQDVLEWDHCG
jgi:hypothetical protein